MPHLRPDRENLPTALRARSRWLRLGADGVPALVVHPDVTVDTSEGRGSGDKPLGGRPGESDWPAPAGGAGIRRVPVVLWMHGRTVNKELDPGRYLRWMRAGIAACAVDLPGHGERFDERMQQADATLAVVEQMVSEIDGVLEALGALDIFDMERVAIGGMSAGGMATLARLCRPHPFRVATIEATTGSWRWQRERAMFQPEIVERLNPIDHLDRWRELPILALHARHDEWVALAGQEEFLEALRARYERPDLVELVVFDRTGAPAEHAGFGRHAATAKDTQLQFLSRWLLNGA